MFWNQSVSAIYICESSYTPVIWVLGPSETIFKGIIGVVFYVLSNGLPQDRIFIQNVSFDS